MTEQFRQPQVDPARAKPARFTAAEFERMAMVGAFDDMKMELIEGELERMNPPMNAHAGRQAAVVGQLWGKVDGHLVRGEVGIRLSPDSAVGCDAAVLRAPVDGHRLLDAAEVLLAIEIAETTLDRDLGIKRQLYGAAGVPHYWVIDTAARVVHVHGSPMLDGYGEVEQICFGATLIVPGTSQAITVD